MSVHLPHYPQGHHLGLISGSEIRVQVEKNVFKGTSLYAGSEMVGIVRGQIGYLWYIHYGYLWYIYLLIYVWIFTQIQTNFSSFVGCIYFV